MVARGGGRGRRRERSHLLEVVPAVPGGGRDGAAGSLIGAAVGPPPRAGRARGGDRGVAPAADDRCRDRVVPGDGAVDRVGGVAAGRAGQAQPARAARAAEPLPRPPRRELLHVDVKKLGRIPDWGAGHRVHGQRRSQRNRTKTNAAGQRERQVGWEYVHVCVDDATRLAYVEVLADEKAITAVAFLKRAIAFYARHGVTAGRVMSDNGPAYRSRIHAFACRALVIRHLRTRPYRPRTNGKACVHPHPAERLGLRRDLPLKPRTHRSP